MNGASSSSTALQIRGLGRVHLFLRGLGMYLAGEFVFSNPNVRSSPQGDVIGGAGGLGRVGGRRLVTA